jgi:cytochrome P450
MDVASSSWNEGAWTMQIARLSPQDTNEIHYISFRMKDIFSRLKGLPVCEIRQLPDWKQRVHLVFDPEAQKLIYQFHRYGFRPGHEVKEQPCPFHEGSMIKRFSSLIGENNLFTTYKGESEKYRKVLRSFFHGNKLAEFSEKWREISHQWIEQQIKKGETELFNSVLNLVGRCLIQGMLEYEECSEEDIEFNQWFWKELLAPSPDELKPLAVLTAEGEPNFFGSTWLGSTWKIAQNIGPLMNKLWIYKVEGLRFHELAEKIFDSTIGKQGSLSHYLHSNGLSRLEILENVRGLLLAGQESVGYTLACLLYEKAKGVNMKNVNQAFKEILRLYPVGGGLREAGEDLILSYPDLEDSSRKKLHYIRKGDRINCYGGILGRDPTVWGDDAEQFNGERPELDSVKTKVLPFGYGVHRCLGEKTAELEITTLATEILSKVKLTTQEEVEDFIDAFTLRPLNDIKVKFEEISPKKEGNLYIGAVN